MKNGVIRLNCYLHLQFLILKISKLSIICSFYVETQILKNSKKQIIKKTQTIKNKQTLKEKDFPPTLKKNAPHQKTRRYLLFLILALSL